MRQAVRAGFRVEESRRVPAVSSTSSPFGQNEWLVEEMYRKFRDDPSSVDEAGTSSSSTTTGTDHRHGRRR
jgi:2-oxoglutarate dehydrogenase complex dehydrogenase (E1) component-like enzyme